MKVSGVILAGGRSSRMGTDKSMLVVNGKRIIDHAVETLQSICAEVIIVSNHSNKYSLEGTIEASDIYTGMGPMAGIHAGLSHSNYEQVFIMACDMPFVSRQLIRLVLERSYGYDISIPRIADVPQPLFGTYHRSCLPVVEQCLQTDIRSVMDLLPLLRVHYVDIQDLAGANPAYHLMNLNTPAEYQAALSINNDSRRSFS